MATVYTNEKTLATLNFFEMREFVKVMKTIRGKTVLKPLGWFRLEDNNVAWFTPEDNQAKLLDMIPDEDEPTIENLSYEQAIERIQNIKAQGLRMLVGEVNELTPAGVYVSI